MDYQDKISSYIENELTAEGEQEFLISLAASETLRRSFRSELVMKNILRQDDHMTSPPSEMRSNVFTAIGLTTAASASDSTPMAVRGFFASKFQTFISAVALVGSITLGYVVHGVIQPEPQSAVSAPASVSAPVKSAPIEIVVPTQDRSITANDAKPVMKSTPRLRHHSTTVTSVQQKPIDHTTLPSGVDLNPQFDHPKK
jgi:hypothetical protein